MLRTLLESKAVHARRTGGTLVSVGVHTSIIALAIVATARATSVRPSPVLHDPGPVIFTAPLTPEPQQHDRPRGGGTWTPVVIKEYRAPAFPIPSTGPIDLSRVDAPSINWGSGPLGPTLPREGLGGPADAIYTGTQVEKAAVPRAGNPAPVYPPGLRAAQIEGSVVARFVVDTTGVAEPQSITFPEATHPQFAEAVRQSLLRSHYLPAMVAERHVRQLVEQHFAFTLTR